MIVSDLGKFAIHTTRKRMIGVQRSRKVEDQTYRAFEFLNRGKYERQHFIGVNPNQSDVQQRLPGMKPAQQNLVEWEEKWTGDFIFENEWQSFRTKKDRSLELTSVYHEVSSGRRKIAVKVVDIFGNDTMTIVEVTV